DPTHRIIRTPLPFTPCQVKRLLQRGELPVNRGRFHPIGIALILISHNPLGAHMIQRWVAEECLESPHARHFPIVVLTSCGMLLDIPVQQFREGSLLLCRFLKESSFDDLDLDLPKNGLSHPFISCPGRSPDLLPLVHKRHPPRSTSLHESHPFTPFQWDSVLWFPRDRKYRPRVLRSQSIALGRHGPFCVFLSEEVWIVV